MTRLDRTTFTVSRQLDFLSEKELTLQCGYGPEEWPLVIAKELVDNALDALEEQGVEPRIVVSVDEGGITVADNGSGVPAEVVESVLDFSVRVSSREAYIAPDRGAQGNALKTIVAMPFVLDGEEGRVDVQGGGVLNEITLSVDRIRQQPQVEIARTTGRTGSFVRVHWPQGASSLAEIDDRFLQVLADYTFLNPHLTLAVDWFGATKVAATDPRWLKWRPSSPTPAHWYRQEELERLIAAYLAHDEAGGRERTVREFVAEFRGLSSTGKQKQVLAELGLAGQPLSALTRDGAFDRERVRRLLAAMQARSMPVKVAALGVIGRDHIATRFSGLDVIPESFQYRKTLSTDADGLPQVTEIAFGARRRGSRRLIVGVNWSAAWVNPFRTLGAYGRSLDSMLAEWRAEQDEPVVVLVHVAHPRVQYTDRGKSSVATGGHRGR